MDDNINIRKEENSKSDDLYRLTMTRDAEKALVEMLDKVNTGFSGGRINRTEMVSWALIQLNKDLSENHLQDIRAIHFDELAALESMYKKAKESGVVSAELRSILLKQTGFDAPTKKPAKIKVDKDVHQ